MSHGRLCVLCTLLLLAAGLASAVPAAGDEGTTKIYRLGNPATTISNRDTKTADELKARVREYATALDVVLAQSGFDGDPQDFFDAVENDRFEQISVSQGSTFPWMASRKQGDPYLLHNVEWASPKPFVAWRLRVETKAATFTFVIPGTCLNLALESRVARPPLSCSLDAEAGKSTVDTLAAITITGRAEPPAELTLSAIGGPAQAFDPRRAERQAAGRWRFQPSAPGTYRFSASAHDTYGREARCQASATVEAKKVVPRPKPRPVCRLSGSYDPTTASIVLASVHAKGTVTATVLSMPDGATGSLEGGEGRWQLAVDKRVRRRGGAYRFAGEAKLDGEVDACSEVQVTIPVPPGPGHRWILRAFGWSGDGDDQARTSDVVGPGVAERTKLGIESPDGAGVSLEYLASHRVGIEGALLIGSADGIFQLDLGNQWARAEDDIDFTVFTVGANFHLTPDRRADVYLGPFVGFVSYDDVSFQTLGRQTRIDFDDDLGFGAQVGVDLPFTRDGRWGFNSALRYLTTTAEEDRGRRRQLDLDPLILSAGISVRF